MKNLGFFDFAAIVFLWAVAGTTAVRNEKSGIF